MMTSRHRTYRRSAITVGLPALVLLTGLGVWGAAWLLSDSDAGTDPPAGQGAGPPGDPTEAGDDPTEVADDGGQEPDANGDAGADIDALPDGEHFGFVSAVTAQAVTFEPAEFLTGGEARQAAREDGAIGPDDDLPNDFYLRYLDTAELTLPLAAGFEASLLDNSDVSETRALDAASMAALYTGELEAPWMYGPREHLPVVLRSEGGNIVRADQQYVP